MKGILRHLLLTLRLNFRSAQPLVYGFLVPIFFLIAFGSVFRSSVPPLVREMGQLLTITVLGGACFGMPTAMVNERERGLWRRYRLLPTATWALILSAMVVRYIIVLLAAVMQIGLAWCIYRTPMPAHPAQLLAAFTIVCFAFLGMGLIIAMLANTVPAVQALGQVIFLPMIMIGGVGVPLRALPTWAQNVAGFLPGRYAVEAMQACINGGGLCDAGFALLALAIIGAAACLTGAKLFRWDAESKTRNSTKPWLLIALAAWACVGVVAWKTDRLRVPPVLTVVAGEPWRQLTDADEKSISYSGLTDDNGTVVPFADTIENLSNDEKKAAIAMREKFPSWPAGNTPDIAQRLRNYLSLCAVADLGHDPKEAEIPFMALEYLRQTIPGTDLRKALAWVVLHPEEGTVLLTAPELGIDSPASEEEVRERCVQYAKKMLLRLTGAYQAAAPSSAM